MPQKFLRQRKIIRFSFLLRSAAYARACSRRGSPLRFAPLLAHASAYRLLVSTYRLLVSAYRLLVSTYRLLLSSIFFLRYLLYATLLSISASEFCSLGIHTNMFKVSVASHSTCRGHVPLLAHAPLTAYRLLQRLHFYLNWKTVHHCCFHILYLHLLF